MTVNLTRHGCAPLGVVSRTGDPAPETRVSPGSPARASRTHHWRREPRCDAAVSFAAYMQALDLEERSALEYAELVAGSSSVGGGE